MKKLILFILLLLMIPLLYAQNHLIISEFCVTPTEGEFIEIYNGTGTTVDLTNYYICDAIFSGDNDYINIVNGTYTPYSSDFLAQFPAGATIEDGDFQVIAFNGTTFNTTYGFDADYEMLGTSVTTPDMLAPGTGYIGPSAGLSNDGEVIILYYWDGVSDLVQDVDIILWGDKAEGVDKTGVSIDGPDADTDVSTYLNDTPIAGQFVVNTDNDADGNPHDDGRSAQRKLPVEDVEEWTGGNGITGHDETGEDVSWMGGIWSLNAVPTPGARALGDSLNIADIQFIRAHEIGQLANDDSPFTGDTLTVTGIVMHGPREVYLGARWGGFIQDERGGPWSGFFVIQNDTMVTGTELYAVQPGDKVRFTGRVEEFPTNVNTQSLSQFVLFTNPAVPVEFIDFDQPMPAPVLLKPGDFAATGSSEDPRLTERWESTLVRFENLTILSNFPGQPGNMMTASDETGTIAIDDYFLNIRQTADDNGGQWPGFPAGTRININGFVRDVYTGGAGRTTINPRTIEDIEIASAPPEITSIVRNPVSVTPGVNVEISATIIDAQTSVAKAEVHYRVDGSDYQISAMTGVENTWSGIIPGQPDGAFIEYFLTAEDTDGDATMSPGDTTKSRYFYFVREGGIGIFDLQYTPYANGNSPYSGLEVTVTGIVTSDTADFSFYYIQNGTEPWHGIWVYDNVNPVKKGDQVTVTGVVQEDFNVTRIANVTKATILSRGNPVPEPIKLRTGDLMTGSPISESYESMLVRVENLVVVNPFPDSPGNYGEFSIDDGSGAVRVDDLGNFRGNLDSTFAAGDSLISLTGIHYYSFGNYKIVPRNNNDVVRWEMSIDDVVKVPEVYDLAQNYPNPFNPSTAIKYQLPNRGRVTIHVFNLLGQRIKTLVDEVKPAGYFTVHWHGTNDLGVPVSSGIYFYRMTSGKFLKTQKMLFMK